MFIFLENYHSPHYGYHSPQLLNFRQNLNGFSIIFDFSTKITTNENNLLRFILFFSVLFS